MRAIPPTFVCLLEDRNQILLLDPTLPLLAYKGHVESGGICETYMPGACTRNRRSAFRRNASVHNPSKQSLDDEALSLAGMPSPPQGGLPAPATGSRNGRPGCIQWKFNRHAGKRKAQNSQNPYLMCI